MTNKVKPFFIRITDDMTPQMVQDAFDRCVDAGAIADECIADTNRKHSYQDEYDTNFNYFGVDDDNITVLYDNHKNYGIDAQETTLDQLDDWLGLESKVEWDGNGLPSVGVECEILFKEYPHKGFGLFNVLAYHGGAIWAQYVGPLENNGKCYTAECSTLEFRKPETPEQKAERERLEAAYDLYNHVQSVRGQLSCKFDWFSNSEMEETRLRFLAIVDKTGYRKQ